jgi:hypothetical protein
MCEGERPPLGTFSHFIALFCTVAGKASSASGAGADFCNQIKDLERKAQLLQRKKPFQMNDLAEAVEVKPQQKTRAQRM